MGYKTQLAKEYEQKIKEMLTVPHLQKNKFLKSVLAFIKDRGYITDKQTFKVDEIDEG